MTTLSVSGLTDYVNVHKDELLVKATVGSKTMKYIDVLPDIKYKDATGANVTVKDITAEQRQKLADFYGYVLKRYMETIPNEKQAGVCKGNMSDTASDPVGLWAVDSKTKDWVRTATYKAFCDVLSGKE